jgi:outer membrane receptor protein involved in Fe transport
MASLSYSYARARYLDAPELRRVPNSPEHMVSFKGAVPLFGKALTLATRLTVESLRLDRNSSDEDPPQEETEAAAIWDVVLSGQVDPGGLRYNVGVYNAADWRYTAPTAVQYTVPKFPQSGRTFLVSANMSF